MDMNKLVKDFLLTEELSESSKPIYENVLMVFGGYYRENKCDLNKLTYSHIFKSLDYYIDERKIKFENTARFYISAVKEFIIYCIDNTDDIINTKLMSLFGYGSNSGGFEDKVDIKINNLIKNKIIRKEKTGIEINSQELKKLIIECDRIIDDFKLEDLNKKVYNGKYMDYVAALGIKIISYTGLKVGLVINLKLDCLMVEREYLMIHNIKKNKRFKVRIPQKLYCQLIKYKDIRNQLIKYKDNKNNTDYLFIDFKLKPLNESSKNGPLNKLIYKIIGKNKEMGSSTARVAKRAIIDMMGAGMSLKMIEDFTGNGKIVIEYCKEKIDEIKREEKDPNEYINKYIYKRNGEDNYKYYDIFQ
ncbi:TPA: tyrosine-type recombinase/integrase [Clostridium botulinum]|nr:tyrosine-type recombinase/integrase [Clostridium botulinum]HCL4461196.1 tyrosine-type recombinase/integrase [Clostridium botulinum]HCL4472253.1 tyrosine-type recombinase/integrase [Clostridium botulinum]HCL4475847.1 tyrosine-type recombinase/integrase [Clostridium botulinum]HCL4479625.1 tyrosine-type recombinase/integrase [Clostridium botulinum]